MMKKSIKTVAACMALSVAVACSEKNDYLFGAKEPFVKLEASAEDEGMFTPDAQEGYGLLRSNARWKVASLSEWLTCSTEKGEFNDTLRFRMEANAGDVREGKIVVYNTVGQRKRDTLVVRQQCAVNFIPKGYAIEIRSKALEKPLIGEEYTEVSFDISSSTSWRVYTKNADSWSTVLTKLGEKDGSGMLIVSKNESVEARSMYVYAQSVEYPTLKDSIEIMQDGRPLVLNIVSPGSKKVLLDNEESTFAFTVKGDGKWKIEGKPEWLRIDKSEYEGDAVVLVKAAAADAERKAVLTVRSLIQTGKTDMLTVEQKKIPAGRMKDSLALVALYEATGGEHWTYPWKLEMPLSDENWPGVFFDHVNGELRVVDLSLLDYNMEGSLPNEIGWLTEVIKIKLQRNKLSGPLPAGINRLTKLTHIYITSNRFSGEFPDISALKSLVWIDMDFNRFEGEFPASFLSLPKLTTLKMKYNKFDKNTCVPKRFGGWRLNLYINPQREVYGDKSTDYKLKDCTD
ncbi:BACON domain-containing protein [Bacteroides pyogenes]|uniref:BACON domain-containing protein n=1 Tax=Bacteroides pyogenes TaxID=310300 RepID=UPI003FA09E76